ncbi:MAG: hypothetical protein ACK4UX_10890 [Thiobacillus sp.]
MAELGGIESLYSDAYYVEASFWRQYGEKDYRALEATFDPEGKAKDLYQKCVLRQ